MYESLEVYVMLFFKEKCLFIQSFCVIFEENLLECVILCGFGLLCWWVFKNNISAASFIYIGGYIWNNQILNTVTFKCKWKQIQITTDYTTIVVCLPSFPFFISRYSLHEFIMEYDKYLATFLPNRHRYIYFFFYFQTMLKIGLLKFFFILLLLILYYYIFIFIF